MSVICEKIPKSEVEKAACENVKDFILVKRCVRPQDIPVAEKWSMDPCFIYTNFEKNAQRIVDFVVKPDDIWLVGFPKSGTTWAQELIWLICNNLNYEVAATKDLQERYPLIDVEGIMGKDWPFSPSISIFEDYPSPRFIKSHLPTSILPTQLWTIRPKIVYVARNFKDMVISYYHYYINIRHFPGTFDDYIDLILDKKVFYGSYHSHVSDFFNMRNEENILFLTYEDMKKDMIPVLRKSSMFFGKNYTDEQLDLLAKHLSFANISKNPSVNQEEKLRNYEKVTETRRKDESFRFMRRGESGAYFDEMSMETAEKLDRFTESEMKRLGCDTEIRKVFYLTK